MDNSLRTADVSPRSSLLRHVSQRLTSLSGDERRKTSAIRRLHYTIGLWGAFSPGAGSWLVGRGDGREKIGERSEPRIVVWGGERVVEPGLPLMPQNHPAVIYYVKTSSFHGCQREPIMSLLWGYLNSRCSKSASKEIYLTSIANWSNANLFQAFRSWGQRKVMWAKKTNKQTKKPARVTTASVKRNKDVSEENAPHATGEEQANS